MLVFSKARLVMLSVPKTGTTAYETALAPLAALVVRDPPELKHAPLYRYNRFFRPMLEKVLGPGIEVIAVMREPVSWLGSWYRYRQRPFLDGQAVSTRGLSFDDFVQAYTRGDRPPHAEVGSQARFLAPAKNGCAVDRIFRYEDPGQLRAFLEARLETRIEVPRSNVSPAAPLTLSPETAARLARRHAADFALYASLR
ncbi:gamma-glutamyl kinase [Pseudooceanicola sp. CBS1P-1]|uniref:Gamma-glutamyl kinase n=1 Tax=Pseudooceanicola albus TaxID=2692189 RepID=A0A6L7FX70_9RHOB|nr:MULTISPECIES: gamma-glutamyl kinase [Pseudooceanicola]MBT9383399.1 gamma-glutamyl kinase [Pseudooceanicola endophyticus]MXN16279.1 gamma-glutamyl kinase [Pseudooceanicola albus]